MGEWAHSFKFADSPGRFYPNFGDVLSQRLRASFPRRGGGVLVSPALPLLVATNSSVFPSSLRCGVLRGPLGVASPALESGMGSGIRRLRAHWSLCHTSKDKSAVASGTDSQLHSGAPSLPQQGPPTLVCPQRVRPKPAAALSWDRKAPTGSRGRRARAPSGEGCGVDVPKFRSSRDV